MRGWAFGQTHQRYRLENGDKREVVLGTSPPLSDRRRRSARVIPFFAPSAARLSDSGFTAAISVGLPRIRSSPVSLGGQPGVESRSDAPRT